MEERLGAFNRLEDENEVLIVVALKSQRFGGLQQLKIVEDPLTNDNRSLREENQALKLKSKEMTGKSKGTRLFLTENRENQKSEVRILGAPKQIPRSREGDRGAVVK